MKFAHTYHDNLALYPSDWQAASIQYRQLKKCIKRVSRELTELGLDVETLKNHLAESEASASGLQYMFDGTVQSIQPKLILRVHNQHNKRDISLALSGETRVALASLLAQRTQPEICCKPTTSSHSSPHTRSSSLLSVPTLSNDADTCSIRSSSSCSSQSSSTSSTSHAAESEPETSETKIEIPLTSDIEFFSSLTTELTSVESVQTVARSTIETEILSLGKAVTVVSSPTIRPNALSAYSKSDLYAWREIFRLYLDMGIFFSPFEKDAHKERTPEDAKARLEKFQTIMKQKNLGGKFKHRTSEQLLFQFITVNEEMYKVFHFDHINKEAMRKILKKFDKRTALGATVAFPEFVRGTPFLANNLARALCSVMQADLVEIIPQLDDYLCPVCSGLAIKPVRLSCSHVYCVRCLVKLQRERKRFCPLCRGDHVLTADAGNLDTGLLNFLRTYFPKEAKEKQRENEEEVIREQWRNVHMRHAQTTQSVNQVAGGESCVVM